MKSPRFKSVEEYLASQDPAKERTLRSVIDLILAEFPELESKISWKSSSLFSVFRQSYSFCSEHFSEASVTRDAM